MNYPKTKKLVELLNMFLGFVETNLSEGKSISKLIKNTAAAVATKGKSKNVDFKAIKSLLLQGVAIPEASSVPVVSIQINKNEISEIKKETDQIIKFLNGGVLSPNLKMFKKLATQISNLNENTTHRLDMYVWAIMNDGKTQNLYYELSGQSFSTFSKADVYESKLEAIQILRLMK